MIEAMLFVLRMVSKYGSSSEAAEAQRHIHGLQRFAASPGVQDLVNRHPSRKGVALGSDGIQVDPRNISINAMSSDEFVEKSAKHLDALGQVLRSKIS